MSICKFLTYVIVFLTLVAVWAGGLDYILGILIGFIIVWLVMGGWILSKIGFDGTCWAVRLFDMIAVRVSIRLRQVWGAVKRCLKGWPQKDEFYDNMYDVGGEVNYTTTALNDRPVFASSQGQGVTVRFTSGVGLGAKVESKGVTGIFSYSWFLGMVGYVVVGGLFGVVTGYVVLSGHWPTIGEVKELGSTALTTILQDGEGGDAAVQMVDHQLTTSVSVISFFQPVDILASLFSQTILSPVTNRPVTAVSIEQVAGFARSVGVADLSVLRSMFSQDPQFGELIVKITEELATKVSVECWAEVSWFWNVLVNSGVTEIRKSLINSGVTEVERAVLFDSMYVAFSDAAEVLVKSVSSFSDIGSVCPIELYVSYLENGGGCLVRCWESAFRALMIYSELVVW